MADQATPTDVRFYFDPVCPWTWVTSRWLVEAAEQRDLTVTWLPYSLLIKNGDDVPEEYRSQVEVGHRALRVIVALGAAEGNAAVHAFYTELGHRLHGDDGDPALDATLTAAGLDASYASAADDERHDAAIEASMDDAHGLAGTGSGSPIIALAGTGRGFFGPVLTAVPSGDTAGVLWDHVAALSAIPEMHELKRDRAVEPTHPPRG